jgi:hypothetical protein
MLEPPRKRQFAGALFPSVIPSEARNLAAGHRQTANREFPRRLRDSG